MNTKPLTFLLALTSLFLFSGSSVAFGVVGYLFFPGRIFRTLKNIFSAPGSHEGKTVLEKRLKHLIQKKWAT